MVKRLPHLEYLSAANVRGITGTCLALIAQHCPNLTSLKYAFPVHTHTHAHARTRTHARTSAFAHLSFVGGYSFSNCKNVSSAPVYNDLPKLTALRVIELAGLPNMGTLLPPPHKHTTQHMTHRNGTHRRHTRHTRDTTTMSSH